MLKWWRCFYFPNSDLRFVCVTNSRTPVSRYHIFKLFFWNAVFLIFGRLNRAADSNNNTKITYTYIAVKVGRKIIFLFQCKFFFFYLKYNYRVFFWNVFRLILSLVNHILWWRCTYVIWYDDIILFLCSSIWCFVLRHASSFITYIVMTIMTYTIVFIYPLNRWPDERRSKIQSDENANHLHLKF